MEKKSNMPNVDELCVKYVFDELDPSEITLVEQAMIEDQNLLIEVESLRSTWKKLKKMPEMDPPANISRAIIDQAIEHSSQQQLFGNRWNNPGLLATAAVVLFSLLISTAYLLPGDEETISANTDANIAGTATTTTTMTFDVQDAENPFGQWFNRENILTISVPERQEHNLTPDSINKNEMRPAEQPIFISPTFRDIQFTGTEF